MNDRQSSEIPGRLCGLEPCVEQSEVPRDFSFGVADGATPDLNVRLTIDGQTASAAGGAHAVELPKQPFDLHGVIEDDRPYADRLRTATDNLRRAIEIQRRARLELERLLSGHG